MFGGHVKLGGVLSPDFKQKKIVLKRIECSLCFETKQRIIILICIYKKYIIYINNYT